MATISFALGTWSCFGKSDATPLRVSNLGSLSFSKKCYTGECHLKAGNSLMRNDPNKKNWIIQSHLKGENSLPNLAAILMNDAEKKQDDGKIWGCHPKVGKSLLNFKAKAKMNDNADDEKKHEKRKDDDSWKAECVMLVILFVFGFIMAKVQKPREIPEAPVTIKMTEQVVAKKIQPLRISNDGKRRPM